MEFLVNMDPVGKARPRFTRGGGTYTDKRTKRAESFIRKAFITAGGRRMERGVPVGVYICAVFPIPKSYSEKRKAECEMGLERPTKKPDADNITKLVMDALNGAAYVDDCQVVDNRVRKEYTQNRNAGGCMVIRVQEMKV